VADIKDVFFSQHFSIRSGKRDILKKTLKKILKDRKKIDGIS
jgi:hypothetical protein